VADVRQAGAASRVLACELLSFGYLRRRHERRKGRQIKERFTISVTVTCECRESWLVPLGGEDPASLVFTCSSCQGRARFSAEQAREIVAEYNLVRRLIDDGRVDPSKPIARADFGTRH